MQPELQPERGDTSGVKPSRPSSGTWSGMAGCCGGGVGSISSSWSKEPFHQGGLRGPTHCSGAENILSSGISLDPFHVNRSRMRAPGEGSQASRWVGMDIPQPRLTHFLQFRLAAAPTCPH